MDAFAVSIGECRQLKSAPASRRPVHQTQWAAQFAAASELCKRGYEVALTMGNHPTKDIMVSSPTGTGFGVDVKGMYKKNFWVVRSKPAREDVFYVFALVPDGAPNRFFVMSQEQVNDAIETEIDRARASAREAGRPEPKDFPGIPWKVVEDFEDCWDQLPS